MGRPLKDAAKAALRTMLRLSPEDRAKVLFALEGIREIEAAARLEQGLIGRSPTRRPRGPAAKAKEASVETPE